MNKLIVGVFVWLLYLVVAPVAALIVAVFNARETIKSGGEVIFTCRFEDSRNEKFQHDD